MDLDPLPGGTMHRFSIRSVMAFILVAGISLAAKLDAHYGKHTVVKFTVIPDGATFRTLAQVLALGQTTSK
jgi:hypothetical protein